jgi:hypothetical protein
MTGFGHPPVAAFISDNVVRMSGLAVFVRKIEAELDKPVEQRNKRKLAFWQAEIDKFPNTAGQKQNYSRFHVPFLFCPFWFFHRFMHRL